MASKHAAQACRADFSCPVCDSAIVDVVQVESLEKLAERLGWSPERLAEARARAAEKRRSNISEQDRARAEALSESLDRTRQALDAAS